MGGDRRGVGGPTARAGFNFGWPTTEGPTGDPRFTAPFHCYTHAAGRAARSPAARSTTRRRRTSPPSTSATTSSPTTAAAGSRASTSATKDVSTVHRRDGARAPGRPRGRRGRQPLLPRARTAAPRLHACASRCRRRRPRSSRTRSATTVTAGAARRSPSPRPARTAALPVAARRRRHQRRDGASATRCSNAQRQRQRRAFRVVVSNAARHGDEQRGDADGDARTGRRPARSTRRRPGRLQRRRHDQLTRAARATPRTARCRRALHLAGRLPPRDHVHPFLPETRAAPAASSRPHGRPEVSADVWYRIWLTVRDAGGLSTRRTATCAAYRAT